MAEKRARYEIEATDGDVMKAVARLENAMHQAAKDLEFEEAARLRDQIQKLKHLGAA